LAPVSLAAVSSELASVEEKVSVGAMASVEVRALVAEDWVSVEEKALVEDWALAAEARASVGEKAVVEDWALAAEAWVSAEESALVEERAWSQEAGSDWAWQSVAMVFPVLVARAAGRHRAGWSEEDYIRACDSVPRVDDWLGVSPVSEDDSSVDDSANCLRSLGDCYRESVVGDTTRAVDDKGFPIRPRLCDCSSTGAMSNSIPIPSIPMACSQARSRVELRGRS
jgi:hypothetical protein